MRLRCIEVERYKGYRHRTRLELRPLTVLVGRNNSGKTALARLLSLISGALMQEESAVGLLPLEVGGLRHGQRFEDLVTGRPMHGRLGLSLGFECTRGPLALRAEIQNVVEPGEEPRQVVTEWAMNSPNGALELVRVGLGPEDGYTVGGIAETPRVAWRGLLPKRPDALASWLPDEVDALRAWAGGVRYLRSPRRLQSSPFPTPAKAPASLGIDGFATPMALAADRALYERVRAWFQATFDADLVLRQAGSNSDLEVSAWPGGTPSSFDQAGQGLSQVLPVAALAFTARQKGSGLDVIEHPAAEIHPGAHGAIANLILENLASEDEDRPIVVETHSEMFLLRARHWVAARKLDAEDLGIYWVFTDADDGAQVQHIPVTSTGEVTAWPEGVFYEDYEEILAIRRAARNAG